MKNLLVKAGILTSESSNSEVVRECKAVLTSMGLKPDLIKYQKQVKEALTSKIANLETKVQKVVTEIKKESEPKKEAKPMEEVKKPEEKLAPAIDQTKKVINQVKAEKK